MHSFSKTISLVLLLLPVGIISQLISTQCAKSMLQVDGLHLLIIQGVSTV